MNKLLVGAHMSIAGGLHLAFQRGKRVGCGTIQIFLKSSNQWKAKRLNKEDVLLFERARRETGIDPVLGHASYLINLASPDGGLYRKSLHAFVLELRRANRLGVPFLIIHPGAHMGAGAEAGLARVAGALRQALEAVPPPVSILLENTAGQGSSLGSRFEELARILESLKGPDRVGLCLDTCHAFAAGYDIRTADGYERMVREVGRLLGPERIRAFHLNDSRSGLGSRVDRHTHIGKGHIGLGAFRSLVNDDRFASVPKILETPKGDGDREDRRNLAVLRSLLQKRSRAFPRE